ncbi:MAG: alpha/beta hydrolase-fold protein [Proteiniphilum sp.]|jgi:S-formylglutathione hydrolase FrmB|nr:alpha/beta hydrolase-fold protein [Proteiniphilum sp.]NCB25759.1 esterase family protein [Bacteroidia bacterium]MDD2936909.1 alpha/beta hydrolase-fold protein [Proteiniphilum sp.]MDD3077096.1 alpha/beta hydrolase-fold protein [Proteiniphilum sp.]MDD3779725.1 alpha/beta hydrolase-fold protein [Proteiniphilum sp.]
MKKVTIVTLLLTLCTMGAFPATVDTINVLSEKMGKEIKTVVIKPQSYNGQDAFPVLYLLHGYSGQYDGWVKMAPHIKDLADYYGMMVVCPDGGFDSWYWDSPVDSTSRYETFVARELTTWVDEHYTTIPSREGRAISGLSMGGHGGLYLAFRNQDIYGACGSMSGGVDIRPFPNSWNMSKNLGSQREHPENWENYTVMKQLHLLTPNALRIIIDCGTEDFFYQVNKRLHEELLYRNIPHDFISRPGAHNGPYWSNAVKYQMLYFHTFFQSRKDS